MLGFILRTRTHKDYGKKSRRKKYIGQSITGMNELQDYLR